MQCAFVKRTSLPSVVDFVSDRPGRLISIGKMPAFLRAVMRGTFATGALALREQPNSTRVGRLLSNSAAVAMSARRVDAVLAWRPLRWSGADGCMADAQVDRLFRELPRCRHSAVQQERQRQRHGGGPFCPGEPTPAASRRYTVVGRCGAPGGDVPLRKAECRRSVAGAVGQGSGGQTDAGPSAPVLFADRRRW